jgi:thermostable 8-oxoguanine DNA glycosylase
MATPGLSFANPFLEKVNVGEQPNPYAPYSPTSSIGLGGLGPSAADLAMTGEALAPQSQFTLPEMKQPPAIAFSPSRKEFFVQGTVFGESDAASALEAERLLSGPSTGLPTDGDWVPLDPQAYGQYLESIRNPSLGRLFSKGFESGGQQFKQLIGGALQAAGAEETGAGIVTSAGERLRQLAPFQREFTEIDSAGDMIDWFVSTLGTQTPLFLESVATGIAGAALGSATAGPGLGTVGGAIAGFFGKKAFRDKVEAAAKRYRAGQVTKDSAEYALLKNASAVAGGTIASGAGEYILGVGDVYNELREQGANPEDASARLTAAAAGLPYAALSILPEALIVGRILSGSSRAALPAPTTTTRVTPGGKTVVTTSPSLPRRGAELLRRGVGGAALFGGIEGASEAAQEGLVMGVSGQDLTSDEAIRKFINSFAAGAAVGGVLGGVANLRSRTPEGEPSPESKEPVNLLEGPQQPLLLEGPQQPLLLGFTPPEGGYQTEIPLEGGMGGVSFGQYMPTGTNLGQGVLDIGVPGAQLTPQEIAARQAGMGAAAPQVELYGEQLDLFAQQPQQQLPFQFAPPAPEPVAQNVPPPTTAMGQQLLSIQRQQQFQQAQAQLEAQRQAELDRLGNVAQAQRQVDIAFPQEPQAQIPTREVAPPQQPAPRQLPLFTPAQAPRPSRGEALRMGIAGAGLPPLDREPTTTPRVDLRRSGQLPLFTQAGEPSVAALRQRAEPTVPTVEAGATQAPPTGFRGKPLTAFQRRAAAKFDELSGEGAFAALDANQRQEWYTEFKKFEDSQATKKPKEKKDAVLKREAKETKTQYRVTYDGKPATVTIIRMKDDPTKIDDVTIKVDGEQFAAVSFGKQGAVTDAKMLNNLIEIEAIDAKGEPDAVPKQGAAKVPVQPKAKPSKKVGKKVRDTKKPAAKGEALKKKKVTQATDDDFERVLGKYNALSPAQRSQVAAKLGVTREQMPDLLDEQTLDVDKAIDEVVGEPKTKKDEAAQAAKPTEKPKAPPPPTPATSRELFDTTIESIETTKDPYEYRMAMMVLFDYAFFPDSNDTKAGITKEALDFVNDLPVDKAFRQAVSVVIQDTGTIDAKKNADLFNTIVRAGMLSDVMASTDIKNLPNEYKVNQVNGDPVSQPKKVDGGLRNEGSVVADLIHELNTRTSAMPAAQQKTNIQKLVALYKEAKAAGQEDHESASGDPISSFFDADGNPYTYIVSKKLRVSTKPITKEQARALEDVGADIDDDYESPLSLDDWNYSRDVPDSDTGRYFRDDGRQITAPVPVGRVQLLVATFLRALSVKPRVSIFKNQADLKARNPELYRRAKAARPQGDFDVASAVGYSFGDGNVIIFSDRVATEQQLKFVLAHETLGHFGMRSLIGDQKFNALMERIYNLDSAIRNGVDAAMAARKQSKAEATEEFLADFAAQLDVSIVARIWNAIKGALNKLGVKFGDEAARYLVSQARRYVRNGDMSAMFDTKQVFRNLAAMETGQDPHGTGRFAQATDMRGDNITAGLMQDNIGGLPSSLTEAAKFFTNSGIDTLAKLDRFLADFFSLLNYRARENPGFSAIHDVISAGRDLSMQMKVTMQEKLAPVLNRAVNFGVDKFSLGEVGGITTQQTKDLNGLLYASQRFAASKLKDYRTLGKEQLFFVDENGQLKLNETEADRVYRMGLLEFEQARDGFEYEVTYEEGGKEVTKKDRFEGIKGLTKEDIRWKGYLLSREAMRDVELKLLEARNLSYIQDKKQSFSEIAELTPDNKLTTEENRGLDRLYKKYKDLYTADMITTADGSINTNPQSIDEANKFIVSVNQAFLGGGSDRNAAVAAYFQGKTADDVVAFIEELKKRIKFPEEGEARFTIQNKMKQIVNENVSNDLANLYTKRTLATGYTPILREGAWEVRVTAYDTAGNPVRLKEGYREQLVYSQFENESEALEMSDRVNKELFSDKKYKVEAYNAQEMKFEEMEVTLKADARAALDAIAAPPDLNLNDFLRGLRQFNIPLAPEKMKGVITALTTQASKARQRLERKFVPGAKPDAVIAITQHIESRASTIAKVTMRPKLNELMNRKLARTNRLWEGDAKLLAALKEKWDTVREDPNSSEDERTLAKREYEKYAYMFDKTNPQGRAQRANMYYNEAARQLAFLDNNKAIEESDFASGKVASTIRSYTSMAQLGASFATGALNYIGAVTNGLPYLATYNSKTAFGGGFGLKRSTVEFLIALNQVGLA